ncbi:hypothetical protein SAMN04244579_02677 [Azotobacter beijerinckii]|uniref:Helix-turn-helix domain-containing protein n=1 Tax=Azotobacter beijerinckii TaxID=170623 RepID=A0A1H6V0N1_9GAMM|nr:hypothetical protein [Azotobacter beijerinckii]SEI98139.1 hypothetical protein SAMN04244579_02677 [Azotobacter beijerinckii]
MAKTAAEQLALCLDFEPVRAERRKPRAQDRRKPRQLGEPYYPFDADLARQTILDQLRKAGGEWVSKSRIFRACGMHPGDVAALAWRMADDGMVEIGQKFWPYDRYRIAGVQ